MDSKNLLGRAVEKKRTGRLEGALADLDQILAADPGHFEALFHSGAVLLDLGDPEAAVARLRAATDIDARPAAPWGVLGKALAAKGDAVGAIQALGEAVDRVPTDADLRTMLIQVLDHAGETEAAIDQYAALAEMEPDQALWRAELGLRLAAADRPGDAITALGDAIRLAPGEVRFQLELGKMNMAHHGFAEAKPQFLACVAAMKSSLDADQWDDALMLENLVNQAFVRSIDGDAHWADCFAHWKDDMARAGERAGASEAQPEPTPNGRPVVGFMLHQGSLLAHVEILLAGIGSAAGRAQAPFDVHIYVLTDSDPALVAACAASGIPLTIADRDWAERSGSVDPFQRLRWLRQRLAQDGILALVWVSDPAFLSFAAAYGMAPVQIYWAMRYHAVYPPQMDGFLTMGPLYRDQLRVQGDPWRAVPVVVTDLAGQIDPAQVRAIRARLGEFDIVTGTLARTEKMESRRFLDGVGEMLKAHPRAVFLWSGMKRSPTVERAFQEMGVAERCVFIGWIDTKLYVRVLDLFLDTAPMGCGVTAMQAMAAGKPVVAFDDPATMWGENVLPLINGEVENPSALADVRQIFRLDTERALLIAAATPSEYAEAAARLIAEPEYRRDVGAAGREFCLKYLADGTAFSKAVTGHIAEILEAAR